MSKREHGSATTITLRAAKRRKSDSSTQEPDAEDAVAVMAEPEGSSDGENGDEEDEHVEEGVKADPKVVKAQGLQIWQAVKTASKDGRALSYDFLRLPSKRQYPDYYVLIKRPICLEDIKQRLDTEQYGSLEGVRADFDLCFKNAKKYNIRESQIWKDAKALQKISHKEYDKLTGNDDDDDGEGGEGKKKKSKAPSLTRLLKNRLQKLVQKTDDSGRPLSFEFMDLPPRKKWPVYYKIIKSPMCIEDIFKKIKRKQYETVEGFIADLNLVFDNALLFNEPHTLIWEDATVLKDYAQRLMQDLQAQAGKSQSAEQQTVGKIVLKVPGAGASKVLQQGAGEAPNASTSQAQLPAATSQTDSKKASNLVVRLPGHAANETPKPMETPARATGNAAPIAPPADTKGKGKTSSKSPSTAAAKAATPAAKATPKVAPKAIPSTVPIQQPAPATPNTIFPPFSGNHYAPQAYYQQPAMQTPHPVTPQPVHAQRAMPAQPGTTPSSAHSNASTPAPGVQTPQEVDPRPLEFVRLITQPVGRRLDLRSSEGVRKWSMRLSPSENKVLVKDVKFAQLEEGGTVDGVEEEEEETGATSSPARKGRRGRGRGKNSQSPKGKEKENDKEPTINGKVKSSPGQEHPKVNGTSEATDSAVDPLDDVFVKVNGAQLSDHAQQGKGVWAVDISAGQHIIEVCRKDGIPWKVYVERRI